MCCLPKGENEWINRKTWTTGKRTFYTYFIISMTKHKKKFKSRLFKTITSGELKAIYIKKGVTNNKKKYKEFKIYIVHYSIIDIRRKKNHLEIIAIIV